MIKLKQDWSIIFLQYYSGCIVQNLLYEQLEAFVLITRIFSTRNECTAMTIQNDDNLLFLGGPKEVQNFLDYLSFVSVTPRRFIYQESNFAYCRIIQFSPFRPVIFEGLWNNDSDQMSRNRINPALFLSPFSPAPSLRLLNLNCSCTYIIDNFFVKWTINDCDKRSASHMDKLCSLATDVKTDLADEEQR